MVVNHIDRNFLISERLYKCDLVKHESDLVKDIARISAEPALSLFIDNRRSCVKQKENVLKISSFFGNNPTDCELKRIIDFIKEDLKDKDSGYDLRRLATKYRYKFPKAH